jgi:hypothetical protein
MTDLPAAPGGQSPGVAGLVLVVVLVIGVFAGRSQRRFTLLLVGLLVTLGIGAAVTVLAAAPGAVADRAAELTGFYAVAVPLTVAYAAGWLCGRGSLLWRLVVLGVAVLVLAVFPYTDAGRVTADTVLGAPAPGPRDGGALR